MPPFFRSRKTWEALGLGKAALLYQRAQQGFSAGSYTGAVIALALRCLWPVSQITARLGAIAMPKGVLAALIATAEPDRHHYYLVHAAEDCLCDWKPTATELDMLQQSLRISYVEDSARWMGSSKHNYWHWLHCQLPKGKVSLADLKLTHPNVIPRRDRIAAPMRLASWIRFETAMTSEDWEGAISLLVSNLHRSDKDLLQLLQSCVAGQQIASMEEAQALLLKNFRVGKDKPSACAQWLTEMARDLLAPIPFREVFVILALFLPQLTFVDGASARQDLWSSPTVRKYGLLVDITPTAAGLQGMHEYRIAFPSWSQAAIFCPAHLQSLDYEQLANSSSNAVHMGCQVGKAYRLVLQENDDCYSVLALLLALATPSRKRKGEESPSEKLRRISSPRNWDVALVPFPEDFAPPPTPAETGPGKSTTWRGTYARVNAFDKCEQLDKPTWLRFLPPKKDKWREDFTEAVREDLLLLGCSSDRQASSHHFALIACNFVSPPR